MCIRDREYTLRGLGQEAILHGWLSYDGGGVNRILPMSQRGDVKYRIFVGWRVVAGVVPKRTFSTQLSRFHVAFQHNLRIGGKPVEMSRCLTVDLQVPADSEIVL